MSTDTGGPAFPCVDHHGNKPTGMTLRDYFAAKAMQKRDWDFFVGWQETERSLQNDAKRCYEIADAMLEARNTKE